MNHRSLNDYEYGKFGLDGEVKTSIAPAYQDAFNRARVSNGFGVFDSKQVLDNDPNAWESIIVGGGSSVSYLQNESTSLLTVGTGINDRVVRQTRQYHPYLPGRSHLAVMTGNFIEHVAGIKKRVGYFDDDDGLFLEQDENGAFCLVLRTSTSGSPVETFRIPQGEWDGDRLDGSKNPRHNPSNLTLDLTKGFIFLIDFQWLGEGTIRFGFEIDRQLHYIHSIHNANRNDTVYMKTPSLPVRYEMVNVTGGSSSTMKQVCTTVISEGGYENPGFEFASGNGATLRAITTRTPIFAIRMAPTYNSAVNRRLAKLLSYDIIVKVNDIYWELVHFHDPSSVTGTFTTANVHSGVQDSKDISAITGTIQHTIRSGYGVAGVGSAGGKVADTSFKQRHSQIDLNHDGSNSQYLVFFATPIGVAADVGVTSTWVEFV